ncbi:hypothetical protein D3C87_1435740 [compost metagenome]
MGEDVRRHPVLQRRCLGLDQFELIVFLGGNVAAGLAALQFLGFRLALQLHLSSGKVVALLDRQEFVVGDAQGALAQPVNFLLDALSAAGFTFGCSIHTPFRHAWRREGQGAATVAVCALRSSQSSA